MLLSKIGHNNNLLLFFLVMTCIICNEVVIQLLRGCQLAAIERSVVCTLWTVFLVQMSKFGRTAFKSCA